MFVQQILIFNRAEDESLIFLLLYILPGIHGHAYLTKYHQSIKWDENLTVVHFLDWGMNTASSNCSWPVFQLRSFFPLSIEHVQLSVVNILTLGGPGLAVT